MTHDAYLKSDSAQAHIQRAAAIAGTNVSVFEYQIDASSPEHDRLTGCGQCTQACAYVNKLPWGAQACRNSREGAGVSSIKRMKPVPFLCHMGFSCVAMPALSNKDTVHALFFGPYCPSEAPDSLELDALHGLEKIENAIVETLPFSLEDIPTSPASTMPDIAEWISETLTAQWQQINTADSAEAEPITDNIIPLPNNKRINDTPMPAQFDAGTIVAALIGGDARQARQLIYSQIDSTRTKRKTRTPILRARSIAVVATVLEWAEQAEATTTLCWEKFPAFQVDVKNCETVDDLSKATMKVLTPIRRQVQKTSKPKSETQYDFVPLNTLITKHFKTGITLNEVAKTLGENPTTITKRLQRTFTLSYSQYVGKMKVEHAKKIFRTTKLSVGEVGQRIGMNDSANFAKLFRTHAHISPSQYRAQYGKIAKTKQGNKS